MWSEPRRAHPAAVIVYSARLLGVLLAPVIVVLTALTTGGSPTLVGTAFIVVGLVVLAAAGAVALAWAEWHRFTFSIDGRTLRVEHGLIVRKSTRLTPERIQSIDTHANLLFRLLGLVTVDVHTASQGNSAEVSIPAMTEADARAFAAELRKRPSQEPSGEPRSDAEAASAPVGPRWGLTIGELVLVSATSSGGLIAMAALAPLVGAFVPAFAEGSAFVLGVVLAMFVAFVAVSWVAGSIVTALAYWGFVASRAGDEVRVERGLLQRETRTVPLDRVQAVRLIEGPLRQMIGRVTIGVDAAGIASGEKGRGSGLTVLHPMLTRSEAARFAQVMVPGHTGGAALCGVPPRARRRYVIRAAAPALPIAVPLTFIVPWGGLTLLVPIALAGWGLLAHADAAYSVRDGVLAVRSRAFARTTVLVRRSRIQSLTVSQHPLQRLAGLGTLVVRVASSPQPATVRLAHLDYAEAIGVIEWVSAGVERGKELPEDADGAAKSV